MVRCCVPDTFQQFDPAEFPQLHAAPVGRRTTRFKAPRTVAAVLITEHTCLPGVVAPQPMRAHQARESIVESRKWLSAGNGRPHQSVHILDGLNLRPDNNAHSPSPYLAGGYLVAVPSFITQ